MAGGYGNMFWPMSRESRPKLFLDIFEKGDSLLRSTYLNCTEVVPKENILIITLNKFRGFVQEILPELPEENILLEPYSRHTGPCIAYSTYEILRRNPNAVIAMTPADTIVNNVEMFRKNLTAAFSHATENPVLMTLGIRPTYPNTDYGYIQVTGGRAEESDIPTKVKTFTEKPNEQLAEVFCKSGEFFWNSGIFVFQGSVIKEELERYTPEITNLFTGWEYALGSPSEQEFLEKAYADCPKISIDYGVMEKTDRAWMLQAQFDWCDIDTWDSMFKYYPKSDENGNVTNSRHPYFEAKNNLILSQNRGKMLAIKGLENYVIVDADDVLLICPRDDESYRDFLAKTALPGYENFR